MSEFILQLGPWLQSEWLVGLALFFVTAALIAAGVPGVVLPLSFSSGALLGGELGIAVIAAGVLAGSQILFVAVRHFMPGRARLRLGEALHRFEEHVHRRGVLYVIALRVVGTPHFLVTAGSALAKVRPGRFAVASLLGFLPAIAITVTAGAAV